jgi:Mg-chelatase subunit ChlD
MSSDWEILILRPVWPIALSAIVLLAIVARRSLARQPVWQRRISLGLRAAMVALIAFALTGIVLRHPFSGRTWSAFSHWRDASGTQKNDPFSGRACPALLKTPEQSPRRALLIDPEATMAEPLREALTSGRIEVDVRTPATLPATLDRLVPFDVVLLSNVPAAAISDEQVAALDRYVAEFGGGLILIGGDRTLTAGGYEGTRLEAMLPVGTYLKTTKKRPRLAMLLVLDRSGSMEGSSIALAKQAARIAVERLTPGDQVGIIAFEDRPHWITPLVEVSDDKRPLLAGIETIRADGGTNMAPALDQAILALRDAYADLRHIILMTDGVSHPGEFAALAEGAAEQGITISTVGVGPEAARPLLADIARTTGGHAYFADDAAELPRIFELETVTAGRAGITEEPFRPDPATEVPLQLDGVDLGAMPTLLGYVDTRAKPHATVALSTPAGDPLLAWWRWRQGLVVAFTSDVRDRWAAAWLRWDGFGPFWRELVQRAMRQDLTRGFSLRLVDTGEGTVRVEVDALDLDGQWIDGVRVTLHRPSADIPMTQTGPGRYAVELPADEYDATDVAFSAEYDGETIATVRQPVQFQAGEPSPEKPKPKEPAIDRTAAVEAAPERPLWRWLLMASVVLFVADVFTQRREPPSRQLVVGRCSADR